jgi:hypothetical protein
LGSVKYIWIPLAATPELIPEGMGASEVGDGVDSSGMDFAQAGRSSVIIRRIVLN